MNSSGPSGKSRSAIKRISYLLIAFFKQKWVIAIILALIVLTASYSMTFNSEFSFSIAMAKPPMGILVNPSFESVSEGSQPLEGWSLLSENASLSVASGVASDGSKSILIDTISGYSMINQTIQWKKISEKAIENGTYGGPMSSYILLLYIRPEKINLSNFRLTARIFVDGIKLAPGVVFSFEGAKRTDVTTWTRYEVTYTPNFGEWSSLFYDIGQLWESAANFGDIKYDPQEFADKNVVLSIKVEGEFTGYLDGIKFVPQPLPSLGVERKVSEFLVVRIYNPSLASLRVQTIYINGSPITYSPWVIVPPYTELVLYVNPNQLSNVTVTEGAFVRVGVRGSRIFFNNADLNIAYSSTPVQDFTLKHV